MAPHISEQVATSRPKSVEDIVKEAQNYDYNPLIPLKYWLRTAGTLLKEVRNTPRRYWASDTKNFAGRDL